MSCGSLVDGEMARETGDDRGPRISSEDVLGVEDQDTQRTKAQGQADSRLRSDLSPSDCVIDLC